MMKKLRFSIAFMFFCIAYSFSQGNTCATATPLTVNATCTFATYTNATATDSGVANPGCASYAGGDVWFTVTVPASGAIEIDTDTGVITDGGMAIYSGTCGALTLIDCDDDDSANGLMPYIAASGLTPGQTIYVRVWEFGNNNNGTFDICVTEPPPAPTNDTCGGAIGLTAEYTCNYTTFTNASALDSGVADPGCANYSGGDVWFSVVVPGSGEITVDSQTGVVTDSGMALYSGTCGSLTLLACDDDGSANGLMSSINQTGLTPGDTVYIRMWEYGNNNNGTFGICVTTVAPPGTNGVNICVGDPSEPLTTDITCSQPGVTSLGASYSGALNAATDPVAQMPLIFIQSADPCAFEPETSNYTFVDFTVTVTGTYIFAMRPNVPDFDAMGYIVNQDIGFTPGVCSAGWVAGDDDDGPNLDPQITTVLTAGVNYRLYTTKFSFANTTHTGPFTWDISTPPVAVEWYTSATGGTAIGTGQIFDPVGVAGSGLVDTNTIGTTSYWAGCPGILPREQADFVIDNCVTCKTWDGSTDSNWYEPSNWTPFGVPNASHCVIIPSTATSLNNAIANTNIGPPVPPATPALAGSITIEANGYLEIEDGTNLVVTDWVDTTNGTGILNIRSGGSLIQVNDAAVNLGNAHMQRSPNANQAAVGSQEYVYWSSPVATFDVANVSPGTIPGLVWHWTPTVGGNGLGNHGDWSNITGNMTLGKGYIARGLSGTPNLIPGTAYPVTANTSLFTGIPNNGVITRTITNGGYDAVGNPGYQGNGPAGTLAYNTDDNWNLLGNPYPSAISANAFVDFNTDINGTVYLWPHTSTAAPIVDPFYNDFVYNYNANDYVEHNNTGSNPPGTNDLYIASGQGFFVLMDHAAGLSSSVTFNNSMRQITTSYDNNNFYDPFNPDNENRATEDNEIERHRIWLDLITADNLANTILVGYAEGATNGMDRLFDGFEFKGPSISFYSLIESEKLSIQGRALPFEDTDTVPLGMVIPENNSYTIAINSLDGLFGNEDQGIYLEDTYEDIITNLRLSPYNFTSEEGTFDDRFILRFVDDTLSITEFTDNEGIEIYSTDEGIHVSSNSNPIDRIEVYDLLGRTIVKIDDLNALDHTMSELQLSQSVYIVKAVLYNDKYKIKKVVH